jgi:hypothetical protein
MQLSLTANSKDRQTRAVFLTTPLCIVLYCIVLYCISSYKSLQNDTGHVQTVVTVKSIIITVKAKNMYI